MVKAEARVEEHRDSIASWREAPQNTAGAAAHCREWAEILADHMAQTTVEVLVSRLRHSEADFLVHGTNGEKGPRSVQIDELENEVLTWAEMDNSGVQSGWD
jgi:hypothetical protein